MTDSYDQIIQKGIQARQTNNRQEALRRFKEAIVIAPNQFRAYREAGIECRDLGLFSEAENFFHQAQIRSSNDLATMVHWAITSRLQGRHALCLQQLTDIVDKKVANGWVYNELAITLKELGRLEEAEQRFRQALAMEPANVNILWQFALFARMIGNRELALAQFETICQYHPLHVGAYLEAVAELQALSRQQEAVKKLQLAFVQTQNPSLLDKYLLLLFEKNAPVAAHELFLHAAYYPISVVLMQRFFNYALACPQDASRLISSPKHLIVALLNQDSFAMRLMYIKSDHFDSFAALLTYFEPVFLSLTADSHQPLINNKLFLLLIVFSRYTKNSDITRYVFEHIEQHIAQFSFSELCKATASLVGLSSENSVLSLFSKVAREQHSVNCLLASLIMRDYYPQESSLSMFDDKEVLIKLLLFFCVPENEAVLKNIFTHFLQKEMLTLTEIKTIHPEPKFIESIQAIDEALKPLFQANRRKFRKPEKLNVALCLSGQLRGYKDAFVAIKKSIVAPLQPDIFVHTWQDVGFKTPFPSVHANRVFHGKFLRAYQDLLLSQNCSYNEIKKMLPTVFSLFDASTAVTPQQLKEFYQTEFVVVEDDQAWPYKTFSNQQKMRHKIDACNQLVQEYGQATGKQYDLVIRLRPDLEVHDTKHADWLQIAETCNSGKAIFVDGCTGLGNLAVSGMYVTGDTIAIGSQDTMNFYSNVSQFKEIFVEYGLTHFSVEITHALLGLGLWVGGYTTKILPLAKGKFINANLKAEDILKAIQNDLGNLDTKIADSFVKALDQDIINPR